MPYAFNLMLDAASALEIERAYAAMAAFGIPEHDLITQYGPCATILVVSDRVAAKTVAGILDWTLPRLAAQPVTIGGPCMIAGTPPALSLRVSPTATLLELHNRIYRELPEEEVHLLYRPAHWQPHVKLANFAGDRAAAATLMARVAAERQSTPGWLDRLEVIQYPPAQAIWQAPLLSRVSP